MVLRSKHFARHIFRHQHKLIQQFLQSQVRLCSGGSQLVQRALRSEEDDLHREIIQPSPSPFPMKLEHAPDVGEQFKYSDLSVRLAAPHQLNPKPDADDISFGKYFTDHMLKIAYHRRLGGWQKPEITPMEHLNLHPAAKVFHYAVELFEGMKAYRGVDGRIRLFRPEMNMARMNITAYRSSLPTFNGDELIRAICRLVMIDSEWVPHHESASLYIRPTIIGIDPQLGVSSSDSALLYTILSPVGAYFKAGGGGLKLYANPKYTRAWPGGVGDRKVGSNYGPTIHVQKEALKHDCHQVLWLYGDDHQLTEVGVMNIFMLHINDNGEKELFTPPLDGLILPGITRDSIIQLCREWGEFQVKEQKFTMPMIRDLAKKGRLLEMFGAGTAAVVSPIECIAYDGEEIYVPTDAQDNPLYQRLYDTLTGIHYGKIDHPWATVID
ncbi:branched-chain-amino-acid aminotransferase, cytosolic [Toxorhynchites rutilus septentrionalis]|uniref:branched-chain-amino-acid aminotransferase, cytosolic n=1 Tax=Toxorhynchites rutilus septentrionalis TaxID=329112 RepID=UPI00247A19F6|nr:branched-chain-amino-acid aminotransferase, cytosolic [Toxorhynchites rutilus septentrionalis]